MTAVMVDASVLLAAFDRDDEQYEPSASILADPDLTVSTLDLARYEVANVVIRSWRAPDEVERLLGVIEMIGEDGGVVRSTAELIAEAAAFADSNNLTVYDATYVVAARSASHTLVSCDVRDLVTAHFAVLPSALTRGES